MHVLRSLCFLRRLALAWFMASLLVAGASPLVNPQAMELVCSASGSVKLIVQGDDGSSAMGMAAMDCPLCVVSTPPPAATQVKLPTPLPLGRALQSIPAARIAAATASPLPAQGCPPLRGCARRRQRDSMSRIPSAPTLGLAALLGVACAPGFAIAQE